MIASESFDASGKVVSDVMAAAPSSAASFPGLIQVDARAADNWDEVR
ncbi:MAG: hypothetical protein ABJM26_20110 [Anderseniella sp.]